MATKRIRNVSQRALAGILTVWLSGFLLLLCCEPVAAAVAGIDSCPFPKVTTDCDKGGGKQHSITRPSNCCETSCFFPAIYDQARKIEPAQKIAQTTLVATVDIVTPGLAVKIFSPPVSYSSFVPNRKKVFIRNRVLRI